MLPTFLLGSLVFMPSVVNLNLLYPPFQNRVASLLEVLQTRQPFKITSGFRSEYEQSKLYAQGRTQPGPKVTNAKWGSSFHNFGLACDLVALVDGKPSWASEHYAWLGPACKEVGLRWGGDFKSIVDLPHVEFPLDTLGLTLADLRKVYAKDGLPGVWKLLDAALHG